MSPRARRAWRRTGQAVLLIGCAAALVFVFLVGQGS